MVGAEIIMIRPSQAAIALLLVALTACASTTQDGADAGTGSTAFPIAGPISVVREDTAAFVYFFPANLDAASTWPALVWFNGASGYTEDFNYNGLLESIASWGFVVIGGKSAGKNPAESDERMELLRRNDDPVDALFGRIDEARIAVAGHSLGGFQTTDASSQYRVAIAVEGAGTPTTSEAAPTLFMTSEEDEVVSSSIVITAFDRAVNVAWLAKHAAANHENPRIDGGVFREPIVAFLRWQLHDDPNGGRWYLGDACVLCEDPNWSVDGR